MRQLTPTLATGLLVLLALTACGSGTNTRTSNAGGDVGTSGTQATTTTTADGPEPISTRGAELSGTTVELPFAVPGPDTLPLYPGAGNIQPGPPITGQVHATIVFNVDASFEEVLAFYAEILPQQGWSPLTPVSDVTGPADKQRVQYGPVGHIWTGDAETNPSQFLLGISGPTGGEVNTRIRLDITMWPNPMAVPVYPDAEAVEKKYQHNLEMEAGYPDVGPLWNYVITYRTKANPRRLEAFYRDALESSGWQLHEESGSISLEQGMIYHYQVTGYPEYSDRAGKVVIIAQSDEHGITTVVATVAATEMPGPN